MEVAGGRRRSTEFEAWHDSEYAVVMDGPAFYGHPSERWNVRPIESGRVYERVRDGNATMLYWAIDLERCQVFFHYESGGFPTNPPR